VGLVHGIAHLKEMLLTPVAGMQLVHALSLVEGEVLL
jgi:hypothetical protein